MSDTIIKRDAPISPFAPMEISDADFNRLYTFIQSNYGIDLSKKRQLITGRLSSTIRQKGYKSFSEFVNHLLTTRDNEEITLVLNKLTTNYTFFMREQDHLELFAKKLLPELVNRHQKDRTLSIWSAGCSSGEEPYNLSMYIFDYLGGRTDAGVHAKKMVTNAKFETDMTPEEICAYLNQYLPEDIGVLKVSIASERFHSRYNAVGKTYCYTCYIGKAKPVFERKYVYALEDIPDVKRMRQAAALLVGTHDFASFCANKKKKKSTVRTVDKIEITVDGDYLKFDVHGDGFLHHMVRILVGTLLEVGWGKRSVESMTELLAAKERAQAGVTAPAQGLCMVSVDY